MRQSPLDEALFRDGRKRRRGKQKKREKEREKEGEASCAQYLLSLGGKGYCLFYRDAQPAGDRIKSKGNNVNQQFQRSSGDQASEI